MIPMNLLPFRGFQARSGTPEIAISDNFKTFISAKQLLTPILDWQFTQGYSPLGEVYGKDIRSVECIAKNTWKRQGGKKKY